MTSLETTLSRLVAEIHEAIELGKQALELRKSNSAPATKADLIEVFFKIKGPLESILMKQTELEQELKQLTTQSSKIAAEQSARFDVLTAKIAELEAAIQAGGDVTQEVTDALAELKTAQQSLDDMIPDAPV